MKTEITGESHQTKASADPATAKRVLSERRFIFLERLSLALAESGFETIREQTAALSRWLNVTPRTAKRWLKKEAFPRSWVTNIAIMQAIDDHTRFDGGWLLGGPYKLKSQRALSEYYDSLPENDQDAVHKFFFLLRNKSPLAQRLLDLVGKGQMSFLQAARAATLRHGTTL